MTIKTNFHPTPGLKIYPETSGLYKVTPNISDQDALTSLNLIVTGDNIDLTNVPVTVDGSANGNMVYDAGTDSWNYVPGAPLVMSVGEHTCVVTFLDTSSTPKTTTFTMKFITDATISSADKSYRKLSSTLGQLKKGFAYDSTYGKMPVAQAIVAPDLGTATAVHAAITLPTTGTTLVSTAITNPDVARNITVTGSAATVAANIVIFGRDINGRTQTETIAAAGVATIAGNKAFAEVTSITVGHRVAAGETVTIGTGAKLGLSRPVIQDADVKVALLDGASEIIAAKSAANGTVTLTTALNGAKDVVVFYDAVVI